MGEFRVAEICLNGHVITATAYSEFEKVAKFCADCGAPTTNKCLSCEAPIRGSYVSFGFLKSGKYKVPNYCHKCGDLYPWTSEKINAIQELIELNETISIEDRKIVIKSMDDLIKDNSRTPVAALKINNILAKADKGTRVAFINIAMDVLSEPAKQALLENKY